MMMAIWLALPLHQAEAYNHPGSAVISIPALQLETSIVNFPVVQNGDGYTWHIDPYESRVGHLQYTSWLGEGGNVVLAGHYNYPDGQPGIFGQLHAVQIGSDITVSQGDTVKTYRVTQVRVVPFTDVSVVYPTGVDQLTLITCNGVYNPALGTYEDRLIVIAEAIN